MNSQQMKEYAKAYKQAHKEQLQANYKAWYEANKEHHRAVCKAWKAENKEQYNLYQKAYIKSDVNSLGQTKHSIRVKSRQILKKSGTKIPGYEIHHCFGYEDPSKFIYISKELHLKIHKYLRDNNIDADTDHFEQIKHLLDESVVLYGLER